MPQSVTIVEVGPRDGFQSVGPMIPTDDKVAILDELYAAGLRRIETTSFVSPSALPQMADAADIVAAGHRSMDWMRRFSCQPPDMPNALSPPVPGTSCSSSRSASCTIAATCVGARTSPWRNMRA